MKRFFLHLCVIFLMSTFLLWAWQLWRFGSADLLFVPAGIVYLGLSLYHACRLPTARERGEAFLLLRSSGGCLLFIFLTNHVLRVIPLLDEPLSGAPLSSPLPFFTPVLQALVEGCYWVLSCGVVALAAFRFCTLSVPRAR